ncbi:NTF2 fold immunity protein [Paenibacillus massiliensis]|uniref:NTF2 fold immunity protein n=1 Tax=Paenibacillus massiliensis TaxID=225917 RepID=UPI000417A021|nr:NTF2 fold immunity protein [Paenibacillus massiliensis]
MTFMDSWEQLMAEQALERDRLRVNHLIIQVEDKKKSKTKVHQRDKKVEYALVKRDIENEQLIGRFELYFADIDTLIKQDRIKADVAFGELIDEHAVAKALFPYVAEHYPYILEDSPFAISYNPVAEAWIIEGTLPPGYMGGVFYIALAKHNGQLLMMYGTR